MWYCHALIACANRDKEIKNPISLARLLLDHSLRPLSLKRVPPNFLAGQGATDFAYEHGMPVVALDELVSPAARDRWRQWRDDLDRAERNKQHEEAQKYGLVTAPSQPSLASYHFQQNEQESLRQHRKRAMGAALRNEGQPLSPPPTDPRDSQDDSAPPRSGSSLSIALAEDTGNTTPDSKAEYSDPRGPLGASSLYASASTNPFSNSTQRMSITSMDMLGSQRNSNGGFLEDDRGYLEDEYGVFGEPDPDQGAVQTDQAHRTLWHDGSSGSDSTTITTGPLRPRPVRRDSMPQYTSDPRLLHAPTDLGGLQGATLFPLPEENAGSPTPKGTTPLSHVRDSPPLPPDPQLVANGWIDGEDRITDTVGAIAIDLYGNIACGASSGGIGMKHRGRIGPAALVGVGAAVKPEDPEDPERTTVATVTSGTGEHMSTTTAARVCSERVYFNVRKVPGGGTQECIEDEAIRGFIEKDFMAHPSVVQSHSSGAIGVLSVKKTKDGAYLFYGHNTDSFAMASMHSNESTPVCTMSRSKGNGSIAQGGRSIRNRKRKG